MTRRLVLSYLTITVIVLVLLELPLAVFFRQREVDGLTVDAERDATVLATYYEDALEGQLELEPQAAVDYAERTGARVVVVDPDGISLIDTGADTPRDLSTRPEIEAALAGERATGTRRSDTLDTELLYVAVPVASGGTVHGGLRVTLDAEEVNERVWRFWLGLIAVGVVILVVMGGVGWIIARSVTRPIRRLQIAAARFSDGDLTPTSPAKGAPPELVDLEVAMNAMAVRLDDLIARQRSFVADASHQLRTPLTALRLRLENLQSDVETAGSDVDLDAFDDQLDRAIDETNRLSGLIDGLLQLARAESPPPPVPTGLTTLAGDRVDTWTAVAELEGVGVELDAPDDDILALAIPGSVEQILDNLLDNAIKSSPAGTTVTVRLVPGAPFHELAISDQGSGLTADEREQALERFWRADSTSAGTGLGLSIVRSLAEASGGTVQLEPNTPTGVVAVVRLPARPVAKLDDSSRETDPERPGRSTGGLGDQGAQPPDSVTPDERTAHGS